MAQPTINELFGSGSSFDPVLQQLTIPDDAFVNEGLLSLALAEPAQILAALVKRSSDALILNTDETVNVESTATVLAPATRNGIDKTLFSFIMEFYLPYSTPSFDASDV